MPRASSRTRRRRSRPSAPPRSCRCAPRSARSRIDLASGVIGESLNDDKKASAIVDRFLADLEAAAAHEGEGGQVMGSASRAALEAAKSALASATGVTRGTGEQLLSAGRDIAGSPQLRALLADPSVEAAEKTGADRPRSSAASTRRPPRLLGALVGVALVELRPSCSTASSSSASARSPISAPDDADIEAELFAFAPRRLERPRARARGRQQARRPGRQGVARRHACSTGKADRRHARDRPAPRAEPARPPHRRAARARRRDRRGCLRRHRRDRHGRRAARPPRSSTRLAATLTAQYGRDPRIAGAHRPRP